MFLEEGLKEIILSNDVPQSADELKKLRQLVEEYVSDKQLIPPLQFNDVLKMSADFILKFSEFKQYQKLIAVLINNNVWQSFIEKIPYNRRILLLPKCLRHSTHCPAKIDELGLLCEQCGNCMIDEIITTAEELGYHSIVSEGTGAVSLLLSSGQIECVIGVGCLDSFERSFPLSVKEAIPSVGIPLFNSDCKDSSVDKEWINEMLPLKNNSNDYIRINLEDVRKEVQTWFSTENLQKIFGTENESLRIANKWLETGGKRWRPLIMTSLHKAIKGNNDLNYEALMKLAISIECFHKASLVHDDIVDDDSERYNKPALHEEYDISIALNTGDLLIAYGYQLISESGVNPEQMSKLLRVASKGHRDLCIGQGQELLLRRKPNTLSVDETIEIFSNKTSPAFEVALKFGAIAANGDEQLLEILEKYSAALGIAYQIQDDLDDFNQESNTNDINALRPSVVLAILGEKSPKKMQSFVKRHQRGDISSAPELYLWAKKEGAITEAQKMLLAYRQQALNILDQLKDPNIKILLYRLLNRIIAEVSQ
jgi:geranylgeranyl pyrophosphate synthase